MQTHETGPRSFGSRRSPPPQSACEQRKHGGSAGQDSTGRDSSTATRSIMHAWAGAQQARTCDSRTQLTHTHVTCAHTHTQANIHARTHAHAHTHTRNPHTMYTHAHTQLRTHSTPPLLGGVRRRALTSPCWPSPQCTTRGSQRAPASFPAIGVCGRGAGGGARQRRPVCPQCSHGKAALVGCVSQRMEEGEREGEGDRGRQTRTHARARAHAHSRKTRSHTSTRFFAGMRAHPAHPLHRAHRHMRTKPEQPHMCDIIRV
jgi:hypothetical protein